MLDLVGGGLSAGPSEVDPIDSRYDVGNIQPKTRSFGDPDEMKGKGIEAKTFVGEAVVVTRVDSVFEGNHDVRSGVRDHAVTVIPKAIEVVE